MFTTGSKFFFGLAGFGFVGRPRLRRPPPAATTSGMDTVLGPLTLGYKGGVGDHVGYTSSWRCRRRRCFLGVRRSSAFRDADPEAVAQVAGTRDRARRSGAPPASTTGRSSAPSASAPCVLGLAISRVLFVARHHRARRRRRRVDRLGPGPTGPPATPASTAASATGSCYPSRSRSLGVLGIGRRRPRHLPDPARAAQDRRRTWSSASSPAVVFVDRRRPRRPAQAQPRRSSPALLLVGGLAVLAGGIVGAIAGPPRASRSTGTRTSRTEARRHRARRRRRSGRPRRSGRRPHGAPS